MFFLKIILKILTKRILEKNVVIYTKCTDENMEMCLVRLT